MALKLLVRGQYNSIPVLADVCFTKSNVNGTNSTISVNTPRGVLGGSIAAMSAGNDYTVVPCTKALTPIGLFVNDAAGAAFENSPAVASGKIAICKFSSVEVDVYETNATGGSGGAITYAVGDLLYSSDNGLLTNETSTSAVVIGVLIKKPVTASPVMGLDMRI